MSGDIGAIVLITTRISSPVFGLMSCFWVAAKLDSGQRWKYADETKRTVDQQGNFHAPEEERIKFGRDPRFPDKHRKYHHDHPHAEHRPNDSHCPQRSGGNTEISPFHWTHDRIAVRRRKKGDPQTQDKQVKNNVGQFGMVSNEREQVKAQAGKGHADGCDHSRLDPIRKAPWEGRKKAYYNGLAYQDYTRALSAEIFDVLQIKAQQKANGIDWAVMDQGRQIGEGKDRISPKYPNVQDWAARFYLYK